jgi:hypothetical protein
MPKQTSKQTTKHLHARAASLAKTYLIQKYRAEYSAKYRENVIALGGACHPTKEERIARLRKEIEAIESRGV